MKHGDFTELAEDYSLYRPGYSPFILDALLGLAGLDPKELRVADVGAGTGIWTRMLAGKGCTCSAVEPNEAMLAKGSIQSEGMNIDWHLAGAESTGLDSDTYNIVTMASSFHWTDFPVATAEFRRIMKPGGLFCALWNTRVIENNPMLVEIENKLGEIKPDMKRVSSGRSEFCDELQNNLKQSPEFDDVIYLEGRHVERMTPQRYCGAWHSVNDIQVQLGEDGFKKFMDFVHEKVDDLEYIEAEYLTRAWIAR